MKLSALAFSAVLAVSVAGSAFAGSCCASKKKAESVAAAAAGAEKKGADCSDKSKTAGTCDKDKGSTSSVVVVAPLASAVKN